MPTGYTILDECDTPEGKACVARENTSGEISFFRVKGQMGKFMAKHIAMMKLQTLKKTFLQSEKNSCNARKVC